MTDRLRSPLRRALPVLLLLVFTVWIIVIVVLIATGPTRGDGNSLRPRPGQESPHIIGARRLSYRSGDHPVNPGALGVCSPRAKILTSLGQKRGAFHLAKS